MFRPEYGQRYYVIEEKKTGIALEDYDPITGYEEVMKFETEGEAEEKLQELYDDEGIDNINDFEIVSYRW